MSIEGRRLLLRIELKVAALYGLKRAFGGSFDDWDIVTLYRSWLLLYTLRTTGKAPVIH